MRKIRSEKKSNTKGRLLNFCCVGFLRITLNKHNIEILGLPLGQQEGLPVCQGHLRSSKTAFSRVCKSAALEFKVSPFLLKGKQQPSLSANPVYCDSLQLSSNARFSQDFLELH